MPEDDYCVVGSDVSRSASPAMMNAAFRHLRIRSSYGAISIPPGDFKRRFARMKRQAFKGMNVTIPFKTSVIPFLDGLDDVSRRIGAVNAIKVTRGRWKGHNTDPDGITEPLQRHLSGSGPVRTALLVGAGGAARSFCEAMNRVGCKDVLVSVRDTSRAGGFILAMSRTFPEVRFSITTISRLEPSGFDLVFNASPVGSGSIPVPEEIKGAVKGARIVFDAVYRPIETELVQAAERAGCVVIRGREMLLHQGMAAFRLWTGREPPENVMSDALSMSLAGVEP